VSRLDGNRVVDTVVQREGMNNVWVLFNDTLKSPDVSVASSNLF
jgi:hypothetical protein